VKLVVLVRPAAESAIAGINRMKEQRGNSPIR
jgi:hypothetical protein